MRKMTSVVLAFAVGMFLMASMVLAQRPEGGGDEPREPGRRGADDRQRPPRDERRGDRRDDRRGGGGAEATTKTGVVKEFTKNPDGDIDGVRLDDGTAVRFPPDASEKVAAAVAVKDKVTVEGWTESEEPVLHAATIKNTASGKAVVVDRPPPGIADNDRQPPRGDREDATDDRPPPPRGDEGGPAPDSRSKPKQQRQPKKDQGKQYSLEQAVSDRAQLHTIAFDGLAFLTGDFACDTFLPPGKVSDYFGFQYMRDIDASEGGHNTSFLTRIAFNTLAILDADQKSQLIALGKEQADDIRRFAEMRLPLIKAFRCNLEGDIPAGSKGLDRKAVMQYSADLYELDGLLAYQRAKVMGGILHGLSKQQKADLAKLRFGDSKTWPELPEQLDKRSMSHTVHVAVMTYASEMFAWQGGSVEADVYFCPERHGMYFGGFGMKTAPAMGKKDYSISTSLTGDSGEGFLATLNDAQRKHITELVDLQRADLAEIVKVRRTISTELRRFQKGQSADKSKVLTLSRRYGELDGELSYLYATAFAKVGKTLTAEQKQALVKMRASNPSDPKGPFLYSSPIKAPVIPNTDFLFGVK